ncbi:hypothetical protein [Streptomyces sp. NPDC059906]|uniref:hypothetical protein n=1 Tax=Streptomyces sp. NPDC059906 TaxID=3346997 RepID=UPI0036684E74
MSDSSQPTILERFPAGGPRGSWLADEYAAGQQDQGTPARIVMDLQSDSFLVITAQPTRRRTVPRRSRAPSDRTLPGPSCSGTSSALFSPAP